MSSTSSTWCAHAEAFVAAASARLGLDSGSRVVELGSNDGYLLQYFHQRGIPCLGIEPTRSTAEVARAKGIETIERFFGLSLAEELACKADLVVANNVLAHVPDINDFVAGIARLLAPTGWASLEFSHLLRQIQGNQFDTVYHEHYSYLSLRVVQRVVAACGLVAADVQEIPTHGGSLRVWLTHVGRAQPSAAIHAVLEEESAAGLECLAAYEGFQARADACRTALRTYLEEAHREGRSVLGYGAAAKGNTLLNFAGVGRDLLAAVADRAASKQGKYLPGSRIPVIDCRQLRALAPDVLLVLPWNLIGEVREQWPGQRLVTAVPSLREWA
jgi:SAM-dependent methyltransferase